MKKAIVFAAVLMLLLIGAGCDKDTFFSNDSNANLKSAEIKEIPIKADIYAVVTEERDGVPYAGNLGGTISHLGNLIFEESTFTRTSFEMREGPKLYWEMYGDVAASNGDLLHYTLTGELNMTLNQYVSTVTYTGGTGRFENATGSVDYTGFIDQSTGYLMMTGSGMITNVGSTK